MKIAFFTDSYFPQQGGIATSVDCFTRSLAKLGHTVYIFAPKIGNFKDSQDKVFRLPSVSAFPHIPDSTRLPLPLPNKNFWKMITFDFDIVHAHGNGAFSLLGLVTARAKKVPFVSTFHIQVGSYVHYFFNGKVIKPKLMNKIFLKKFGNICDGVIAPSEKMKSHLTEAGVNKKIEIIPSFVDTEKFSNLKTGFLHNRCHIPKNSPIILSVGRVGKEKNFEFLVKVFHKVTLSNKDAHFVIVGRDWGEKKNLINLATDLKIRNRFHLIGGIDLADMPSVYSDAAIFTFASFSETQGLCVLEAATAGLPLLIVEDLAFQGMVQNNKNGFILPLDQKQFADKIIQLLNKPKLLEKFKKNSPKIAEKSFGSKLITSRLISFYKETRKAYVKPT